MIRRPPRSTRTDTFFPYATLFRSSGHSKDFRVQVPPVRVLLFDQRQLSRTRSGLDLLLAGDGVRHRREHLEPRSEEHTSELQSLMRISNAGFCLKKKQKYINTTESTHTP